MVGNNYSENVLRVHKQVLFNDKNSILKLNVYLFGNFYIQRFLFTILIVVDILILKASMIKNYNVYFVGPFYVYAFAYLA